MIDPWYIENLVCPIDRLPLRQEDNYLISNEGRRYPIAHGVPVLLVPDRRQTIGIAAASIRAASMIANGDADEYCISTIGLTVKEKTALLDLVRDQQPNTLDPVVSYLVGATNGIAYERLRGKLQDYPIPGIPLPDGGGKFLLDIGCNWGRWCIAATEKNYQAVGIDPSLGAVLAARRISVARGQNCRFVVGDARWLPFRNELFDRVWSFSVIQHFSKEDAAATLEEIFRVLADGGKADIQMPNALGIRCLWHQIRRHFREPEDFEVRYYFVPELRRMFNSRIGDTSIGVHCFFGIGLLRSDYRYLKPTGKLALIASEVLRRLSFALPPLKYVADSVYLECKKQV